MNHNTECSRALLMQELQTTLEQNPDILKDEQAIRKVADKLGIAFVSVIDNDGATSECTFISQGWPAKGMVFTATLDPAGHARITQQPAL